MDGEPSFKAPGQALPLQTEKLELRVGGWLARGQGLAGTRLAGLPSPRPLPSLQPSWACLPKVVMHELSFPGGHTEGTARAGQSPRVESRGALDPLLESSCCPMPTPLNHGLEATPGQEPECNLAQHQKEKLLAAVLPAKETTDGLIFMSRVLKEKRKRILS